MENNMTDETVTTPATPTTEVSSPVEPVVAPVVETPVVAPAAPVVVETKTQEAEGLLVHGIKLVYCLIRKGVELIEKVLGGIYTLIKGLISKL